MKTLNACFERPSEPAVLSRLRRTFLAGSACAALLLVTPSARAADRTVLSGHVPKAVANATPVGPLSGDTHLRLAIGLPLHDPQGLDNYLRDIYNPQSTNYHHYLTPAEFTERFGPTPADYQNVMAFARANGLAITNMHPNHMLLDVDGPVSAIEQAFNVHMGVFKHPKESRNFYAPTNEPSVPAGLAILDISGLSDYQLPHPKYRVLTNAPGAKPALGSAPGGAYMGADFRNAYIPGVAWKGAGQVVGLLQFDGYYASDITAYEQLNNLPAVPLQNVLLDGFSGTPTGNGGEVEVSLDLEMVISMAPQISTIYVYEAGPFGTPNDILNRMANDNLAKQISCSWGWGGGPQSTTEQIFLQMAAQGQTFMNASGDGDAFAPGQVDDPNFPGSPSSSPNILQVGATTLSTSGPGGSWVSEKVWQWGYAGSSGGVSSYYAIPTWQQGINMSTNMGSTTHRNIPDVAMVGDNVFVIADQGNQMSVGGTSCAAPLWGAFTSLVNEQAASAGLPPVGFMNPAIYGIGTGSSYGSCFHDITVGNNTNAASPDLYYACPGYDLCDGWGTPGGSNLINTLAPASPVPVFTITGTNVVGGNGNGAVDPNECNSLFIALQNTGTAPATSVQVQISTSTPGVTVAQGFAAYPNMTNGAVATNVNPFEISTTPTFICGTPVYLTLSIKCDQAVGTVVLRLPTGQPGQPVRYNNSVPVTVTTGVTNGTASTIIVTNMETSIEHVTVSAYIFESFDFGLTLQLVGPDGTAVTLVQNVLDGGQDFGINCSPDSSRTTFDDNSGNSLANGQAPFNGTFQPMQPLSLFIGKQGTNANGAWQLLASDPYSGDFAAIECWSLMLTPALCTDGGGQCPGVDLALRMNASPNPVPVSSNLTYTITVTNLGPDTATSVALVQNLPGSVNVVSTVSSQGSCTVAGGLLTANLGTLVVGQSATVTVVVTPTQAGTIYSTATVGSQEPQLNPGDNTATVAVQVEAPAADLAVSLTANPNPVMLDGLLTYTATVINHGPSVASNVMFTNILPQNVLLISQSTTRGSVSGAANYVIGNLGNLGVGSNAVVTMKVQPLSLGPITDTASVSSSVHDPAPANNVATLNVNVTAAADLSLTMTGPQAVVYGSNYTYTITVVNNGPSVATDVTLHDAVPDMLFIDDTNTTAGNLTVSDDNLVTCVVTNLAVGASFTTTITVDSEFVSPVPITLPNTATVSGDQGDPYTNNNTATISTFINYPTETIVASSYQLISESFLPTNGMIDPGETVTVAFALQNIGNIDSPGSVSATLLNSGGVTPVGNPTRVYPTLTANGPAASEAFTFTASSTNGGLIVASLQFQDNGSNVIVNFPFVLSLANSFANTNNIIIPDHGPGQPYPSGITVSGLSNIIGKVTVTFTNFNHTYPDDVDMLLVGPKGQNVLLMSHAGGGGVLTNTELTFDSGIVNGNGTPKLLPASSQIVSGTYRPGQYDVTNVNFTNTFGGTITIPSNNPPPLPPYGTNLNVFNGTSANGQWTLYVFDSSVGDQGIIIGGWSLGVTTGNEVNPVADIGITGKGSPNPVLEGANLVYTFTVTNGGPNVANLVNFTDALPAGLSLVSATNSVHVACMTNGNGLVTCALTNMAPNSIVTFSIVAVPTTAGTVVNTASVVGSEADPNISNNSATVGTTVTAPVTDIAVAITGATNAVTGSNVLYAINVVNNGPGTAFNVVLTDPLQGLLHYVSGHATGSGSQPNTNGNSVVCNIGTLAAGADATINLVLNSTSALIITNTVTVTTTSSDTNSANNSASAVTVFQSPAPAIIAASSHLISGPANGSLVPGQSATISLGLANVGSANTTSNFTATLLATGGVSSPSSPVTYGVLTAGGATKTGNFSFTATGANNGSNVLTLQLADGANNLGTVSFAFNLPGTNAFGANVYILIPDHGAATPYPSTLVVSNLQGVISKATVTVSNFSHQFPNDVEMLLEAPSGQNIVLMAHDGGGSPVTDLDFTFDDSASSKLPVSSDTVIAPLVSGTFQPTDYGLALPFPGPAPVTPTGSALSAFNGISPNGTWSLYVFDNSPGDSGSIASGWSLSLATISPVNQPADLALSMSAPGGLLYAGIPVVINMTVTNNGPADATDVSVTNTLTSGLNFVQTSAGHSNGLFGSIVCNLGIVPAGSSTNFTFTVTPTKGGSFVVNGTVGADQTDENLQNNTAQAALAVQGGPGFTGQTSYDVNGVLVGLQLTINGAAGNYKIVSSTNLFTPLTNWTTVTNLTSTNGILNFTDTNLTGFHQRYYRAVFVP